MSFMDPYEVVERGNAAARLLQDQAFIDVFNTRTNYHTSALLGSTPEAKETREWHFTMVRAFQELHQELVELVAIGESTSRMIAERHLEDTEDDD